MRCRASILESRVVHGPVAMIVGDRLTAERPRPLATRRLPLRRQS